MHIEMSFYEAVGVLAVLVTAFWGLMKMIARQFAAILDARFAAMSERQAAQEKELSDKLKNFDSLMMDMRRLEVESLKREAEGLRIFCSKDELREASGRTEKLLSEIFDQLRHINGNIGGKVDREECTACKFRA